MRFSLIWLIFFITELRKAQVMLLRSFRSGSGVKFAKELGLGAYDSEPGIVLIFSWLASLDRKLDHQKCCFTRTMFMKLLLTCYITNKIGFHDLQGSK